MVIRKRNNYEGLQLSGWCYPVYREGQTESIRIFDSPVLHGECFSLLVEKGLRASIFTVSQDSLTARSVGESWAQTIRYITPGFWAKPINEIISQLFNHLNCQGSMLLHLRAFQQKPRASGPNLQPCFVRDDSCPAPSSTPSYCSLFPRIQSGSFLASFHSLSATSL